MNWKGSFLLLCPTFSCSDTKWSQKWCKYIYNLQSLRCRYIGRVFILEPDTHISVYPDYHSHQDRGKFPYPAICIQSKGLILNQSLCQMLNGVMASIQTSNPRALLVCSLMSIHIFTHQSLHSYIHYKHEMKFACPLHSSFDISHSSSMPHKNSNCFESS